jgi:hypothetical protein
VNIKPLAVLAVCFGISAFGQGTATRAASIPHTAEGKPDFSGVWQADNGASWNILDHRADYNSPGGKGVVEGNALPYQPAAAAKQKENAAHLENDPLAHCLLPGIPRAEYVSPFRILQTPQQIVILYEYAHGWRTIPIGWKHPAGGDLQSSRMGDSVAAWDGDTLVIDATGFNGASWFDMAGNFHSEDLHVVERLKMLDAHTIAYEAAIEDPKVFTKPWKMSFSITGHPDMQLQEYECSEAGK